MNTKLCMSMVVAGVAALSGSALADGYAGAAARPFSWTGIYVGGQGGFGEARSNFVFDAIPGFPFDQIHWPISGGFVGGMVGANYQVGALVLGVQAEYNWADLNGDQVDVFGFKHTAKLDDFGSVDGRLGFAIGRALGYVIGGWAWGDPRQRLEVLGVPGAVESFNGGQKDGWDAGFGLEYAFWGGFTGRLEYRHYDFGSVTQPTLFGAPILQHTERMERVDTARLGIAYKFGGDRDYLPLK